MPWIDFEELKRQVSLARVLALVGWQWRLSHAGTQRGPCPLTEDAPPKSRSFAVTGERWYCHDCRTGGDAIRLWATYRGITQYAAALELVEKFAVHSAFRAAPSGAGTKKGNGSHPWAHPD